MPAAAAARHTKTRGMIITALDLLRFLLLLILYSSQISMIIPVQTYLG